MKKNKKKKLRKRAIASLLPLSTAPIVFQGVMDRLLAWIDESDDRETGGQLFGYITADGVPCVTYALGPGPRSQRDATFFRQEEDYLLSFVRLTREHPQCRYIGEWHSHWRLNLPRPSGYDIQTVERHLHGRQRFILAIGSLMGRQAEIRPFYFSPEVSAEPQEWQIVAGDGLQPIIDPLVGDKLMLPCNKKNCYYA